jgi:hypothetical protein
MQLDHEKHMHRSAGVKENDKTNNHHTLLMRKITKNSTHEKKSEIKWRH